MSSRSSAVRCRVIDPTWQAIQPFRFFRRSAVNRIQSRPFRTWCFGWLITITIIAAMRI
ncbi:MAG: hypothetical protein JO275_15120 [Verrucomicrobia bacterium]|nr:hypothetical protein [Verrucomicrobiota bacterium]